MNWIKIIQKADGIEDSTTQLVNLDNVTRVLDVGENGVVLGFVDGDTVWYSASFEEIEKLICHLGETRSEQERWLNGEM